MVGPLNNVGATPPVNDRAEVDARNRASREFMTFFQPDKRVAEVTRERNDQRRSQRGAAAVEQEASQSRREAAEADQPQTPRVPPQGAQVAQQALAQGQSRAAAPGYDARALAGRQGAQRPPSGAEAQSAAANRPAPLVGGPGPQPSVAARLLGVSLPQGLPGPVTVLTTPEALAAGMAEPRMPLVGPPIGRVPPRGFGAPPPRALDPSAAQSGGVPAQLDAPLVAPAAPVGLGLAEPPRGAPLGLNRATPPEVVDRVSAFLGGAQLDRAPFNITPMDPLAPEPPPGAFPRPVGPRAIPPSPLARAVARSSTALKPANDVALFAPANDGPGAYDALAANDAPAPISQVFYRETLDRSRTPTPPAFEDDPLLDRGGPSGGFPGLGGPRF